MYQALNLDPSKVDIELACRYFSLLEKEVILDNDFDFLVKNFQILKIPKEKSQAISEKLRNKRKLRDVLKEEEIEFPFNQEIINRIYNFSTKSIEIIDFLSIRILYMIIPWIIRINDQTKEDFVYPMLSSYIFVMRSSFANLGKKTPKNSKLKPI